MCGRESEFESEREREREGGRGRERQREREGGRGGGERETVRGRVGKRAQPVDDLACVHLELRVEG